MVRENFEHALDEISRHWQILKGVYGSVNTLDSSSAIFSPNEKNSNITIVREDTRSRDTRNLKKSVSMCDYEEKQKRKKETRPEFWDWDSTNSNGT